MYFTSLQLKKFIYKTLSQSNISEATKIQEEVLPWTILNKSAIITSRTGSGKTLCYLLPILNNIDLEYKEVQALIVLPTKELARQVFSKLEEFKKNEPLLKTLLLVGNEDQKRQIDKLKCSKPQIVVGTIGKVHEFVKNKLITKKIKTFVLDEVDMLFDLGFKKIVDELFSAIDSNNLQKIVCSATAHESFAGQLKKHLKNTKVFSTSSSIWENKQIKHTIVYSKDNYNPYDTLVRFLPNINPYFCIIFANTKDEVNKIYQILVNQKYNVAMLHKDLTTRERKNTFKDINANKLQYLVATDLASRGIDVVGADVVISFGLPDEDIWYIHRAGRVGRYKNIGEVFVIYKNGIDNKIIKFSHNRIDWCYSLLNSDNTLSDKPLRLKAPRKIVFDAKTNNEIRKIINVNSRKVKPGYKKRIKEQIQKVKQKKKREYIESKVKQNLLRKNIEESKKRNI